MSEAVTKVLRRIPGLRGLWLFDHRLKIPKRHLGARIHTLWIYDPEELSLSNGPFPAYPCYYAGYVLLPGAQEITSRFVKDSRARDTWRAGRILHVSCDGIRKMEELEDPLCGDTGVFELWLRGSARVLAKYYHKQLRNGGYLMQNLTLRVSL